MAGYNGKTREEKDREKKRTRIILMFCVFAVICVIMIVFWGVSNPYGLESFFRSIINGVMEFLKELRFKLDVYFRFFKSIFER